MNNNRNHPSGLEPGSNITLSCRDLTHDGRGVCRHNGFTLFVPGMLPEEQGRVTVTRLKKNCGEARLTGLTVQSPDRIPSVCPENCGGCPLRRWAYPRQLIWKTSRVQRALQDTGFWSEEEAAATVRPALPCAARDSGWRNKAVLHAGRNGRFGFYAAGSSTVVPTGDCPMLEQPLRRIVRALASGPGLFSNGLIREIQLRNGARPLAALGAHRTVPRGQLEAITGLLSDAGAEEILLCDTRWQTVAVLKGCGETQIPLGPVSYPVTPDTFFQVNTTQTGRLFQPVLDSALQMQPAEILDIFCGSGALALQLAAACRVPVTGIERNPHSIKLAAKTAAELGLQAEFLAGEAEQLYPRTVTRSAGPVLVCLDPPRSGCAPELLEALISAAPQKIMYISCNPATLARDLHRLCRSGYRLEQITAVDMFPDSAHIECVAELSPGTPLHNTL